MKSTQQITPGSVFEFNGGIHCVVCINSFRVNGQHKRSFVITDCYTKRRKYYALLPDGRREKRLSLITQCVYDLQEFARTCRCVRMPDLISEGLQNAVYSKHPDGSIRAYLRIETYKSDSSQTHEWVESEAIRSAVGEADRG